MREEKNRPIGVFDSGLGGLTAVKEIGLRLPHEEIVYFGDTGRVPYGTRSAQTICRYALQDMRFLLKEADCKAVVVACGTVSANAMSLLQQSFSVPVIGVIEPAVDAAVAATKNGRIGVIATPSSIASGVYEKTLHEKNSDLQVFCAACALLVPLVENGFTDPEDPIPTLTVQRYLRPLAEAGIDTLILGCTHYPLLKPIIQRMLPDVTLIDTGVAAAGALCALLDKDDLHRTDTDTCGGQMNFFVSDAPNGFAQAAARFLGTADGTLPAVRHINIEEY